MKGAEKQNKSPHLRAQNWFCTREVHLTQKKRTGTRVVVMWLKTVYDVLLTQALPVDLDADVEFSRRRQNAI